MIVSYVLLRMSRHAYEKTLLSGMDDEELLRSIFLLHDSLRGSAGRS